jgi:hypothetical protein
MSTNLRFLKLSDFRFPFCKKVLIKIKMMITQKVYGNLVNGLYISKKDMVSNVSDIHLVCSSNFIVIILKV